MQRVKKYAPLYAALFPLAIPMALQSLITFGIGLADNVMVSSLGDLALSGVFLSNQMQNILQMLTIGVSAAMVVLTTQYLGKEDKKNAKVIIAIVMQLSMAAAAVCTLAVALFPRFVLGLFTDEGAVVTEGMKYIGIVCWSYPFFCGTNVLLSAMRCVQSTKIGLYNSLLGFCLNIGLNWVLIFGHWGAPAMGVAGAALATLIARIAEFLAVFLYVRYADKKLALRVKDFFAFRLTLARDFFRYGIPVILGDVIWGIAASVQVAILGRLGAQVVAANTVAGNLSQVFGVMVFSLASACGIIVGRMVGAGEHEKLREYTGPLQVIFLLFGLVTGLVTFLCKDAILSLAFTGLSPAAHHYAIQFITVLSVTIVGTAYQMSVLTGIVRAGGATDFVLKNDLFWVWVVVIPSALLAATLFKAPPAVVFLCLKCDQILKCSVAVVKLRRYDWMKKLTRDAAE